MSSNAIRLVIAGAAVVVGAIVLSQAMKRTAKQASSNPVTQAPNNTMANVSQQASVLVVPTEAFKDQKPGTSGLRKKTKQFVGKHYLENFIQSTFNSLKGLQGQTLVVSGDGRYYNATAVNIIIRMAAANGIGKIVVGQDFLMSTPAVSHVIRKIKAYGGIILTASHNPGGPEEDFGVKYNCDNGGPAPEKVTNQIYEQSLSITEYRITSDKPSFDPSKPGTTKFHDMEVEVMDAAAEYSWAMQQIFDFATLKKFVARKDFSMVYDSMHGVAGPFAQQIFVKDLGMEQKVCLNGVPKEDFGGGHPDPNLTYAHDLVHIMGLTAQGTVLPGANPEEVPQFGAAADGDADRNMVLGRQFFVTPSDSVAIIAANAQSCMPYFQKNDLKGVARSMPTSGAIDLVARKLGLEFHEVPTGWKFFGNLMDAGLIQICGEESFGTGSDHIREKDGIWAVLAWLAILQHKNEGSESLVTVEDVVTDHWKAYGRNYYTRYDFEGLEPEKANGLMDFLRDLITRASGEDWGAYKIAQADEFEYADPVDHSVSKQQGIRFIFSDGSRIIFRLSGTGSSSATIRLYIEAYEQDKIDLPVAEALRELVALALRNAKLMDYIGTETPTVIT